MQQIRHFRLRMIYEFYLGTQVMAIIAILVFTKHFFIQLDSLPINIFLLLYGTYVIAKILPYIRKFYFLDAKDDFKPRLWISFLDCIFLSSFIYMANDYFNILSQLFYIYLLLTIILFHQRYTWLCTSFTAFCYVLLAMLKDPKAIFSLSVINQIFLLYLIAYIMSSVMNEISKLEEHTWYMFKELEHKNAKLKEMANSDYLTSLYNHRTFHFHYNELIRNSYTSHSPFSLAMLDIDNFKSINDTYGHLVGDKILKEVSALVLANLHEKDIAARYGGEEFAIIFPNTSLEEGEKICENIRRSIENHVFNTDSHTIRITISGGIAGGFFSTPYCKHYRFLEFVDQLLYKAKSQGKNRILSAPQAINLDE